ncbi:MAG: LPP20 family lipoprotein [Selenomonadaceae bacterium]|nr:LPP20 family lipoprotein [Selenomonadaceae bacterium]
MKKFLQVLLTALMVMTFSVASAAQIGNDGFVEVEGVVYPEPGESLNDMRRVAIAEAYRALAEEVDNLHVTSDTTIVKSRRVNDQINISVDAILSGVKIAKVYRESDGSFHAIARLGVYGGSSSLAGVVLPTDVVHEDFPSPKMTAMESISSSQNYTGLIVDCRGKNLDTAIAPVIESAGGDRVYAYEQISRQTAISFGMVDYSKDMNSGVSRAGNTPLVVKAVRVSGSCDPVISQEDADKVLVANQANHFLDNCSVVIVY